MNKTTQLMAAITASLLVAVWFRVPSLPQRISNSKQNSQTKISKPIQHCSRIATSCQKSLKNLAAKNADSAKTVDEVAKQLPTLTHAQLEEALDSLRQDDYIRRAGQAAKMTLTATIYQPIRVNRNYESVNQISEPAGGFLSAPRPLASSTLEDAFDILEVYRIKKARFGRTPGRCIRVGCRLQKRPRQC